MRQTLSVSGIEMGTVIDHIPSGQAFRIIECLKLSESRHQITIGIHLPSKSMALKDLIKVEGMQFDEHNVSAICLFAPTATINLIEHFKVIRKIKAALPSLVEQVFICPNKICITHTERVQSYFYVETQGHRVQLNCKYCERSFDRNQMRLVNHEKLDHTSCGH